MGSTERPYRTGTPMQMFRAGASGCTGPESMMSAQESPHPARLMVTASFRALMTA